MVLSISPPTPISFRDGRSRIACFRSHSQFRLRSDRSSARRNAAALFLPKSSRSLRIPGVRLLHTRLGRPAASADRATGTHSARGTARDEITSHEFPVSMKAAGSVSPPMISAECSRGVVESQFGEFVATKSTRQQDGKQRPVPFSFQTVRAWLLPKCLPLFGGQPIAQSDAQLLDTLHAPNPGGQVCAPETAI